MTNVTVQFPESLYSTLGQSPEELARGIRIAAAVDWYQRGLVSQSVGAELAGLPRVDFIEALSRRGVDALQEDADSLSQSVDLLCS